jgi:hypothetical protein
MLCCLATHRATHAGSCLRPQLEAQQQAADSADAQWSTTRTDGSRMNWQQLHMVLSGIIWGGALAIVLASQLRAETECTGQAAVLPYSLYS